MRNILLVSLIALTASASFSIPSFAQQRGGTRSSESKSRGEYYEGANNQERRPRYLWPTKSGAYCSTHWVVLHDEYGNRTRVRHCDERRDVEIN